MAQKRCDWARHTLEIAYHDAEWGKPLHDDRLLFEMLVLEGMQAGLSWLTVLKKREAFRVAFDGFDPAIVAAYGEAKIASLLADPGIIRNRLKINAAVTNAQEFLRIQKECGSFDRYLWDFTGGEQIVNVWDSMERIPVTSPLSDALSKDLRKRGFRFVGSTICYSFLQAVGVINDHMTWCCQYHNCESRG